MFIDGSKIGGFTKEEIRKMPSFGNRHHVTFYFARTKLHGIDRIVVLGQENEFGDFMYREIYFFTYNDAYQALKEKRGI